MLHKMVDTLEFYGLANVLNGVKSGCFSSLMCTSKIMVDIHTNRSMPSSYTVSAYERMLPIMNDMIEKRMPESYIGSRVPLSLVREHGVQPLNAYFAVTDTMTMVENFNQTLRSLRGNMSITSFISGFLAGLEHHLQGKNEPIQANDIGLSGYNAFHDCGMPKYVSSLAISSKERTPIIKDSGKEFLMKELLIFDRMREQPVVMLEDEDGWTTFHYIFCRPRAGVLDGKIANFLYRLKDAGILPSEQNNADISPDEILDIMRHDTSPQTRSAYESLKLFAKQTAESITPSKRRTV